MSLEAIISLATRTASWSSRSWTGSARAAGKPMMSNEEFDNLKQELIWEGSKVVVLSSAEQARDKCLCARALPIRALTLHFHAQRFLEASMAFAAGKPPLTPVPETPFKGW